MKFERFEDIIVWKKAKSLTISLYKKLENNKDFNFKNQIIKAAISTMNNISEGFEKKSNNEFKHFLFIAKGSSGEIRSMLSLELELNYFTNEEHEFYFKNSCSSFVK